MQIKAAFFPSDYMKRAKSAQVANISIKSGFSILFYFHQKNFEKITIIIMQIKAAFFPSDYMKRAKSAQVANISIKSDFSILFYFHQKNFDKITIIIMQIKAAQMARKHFVS